MTGNTHVVVIGGGYAGVMAANRLALCDDVMVTLIIARPDLVHRVRLHQLVGESRSSPIRTSWPSTSGWWSTPRPGSTRPSAPTAPRHRPPPTGQPDLCVLRGSCRGRM